MPAPFRLPTRFPAYPRLPEFVAPARAQSEVWRLMLVIVLTVILFAVVTRMALGLLAGIAGPFWTEVILRAMQGGRTAVGVVGVLWSFLPMALALALALRLLHDRGWTTLLGPARPALRMALWVGGALLALQLVMLSLMLISPDVGRHLRFDQQWPWLVPAVLGVVVQSSTEEALFRGYFLQQLGARSASPWAWMVLPSALFAALHLDAGTSGLQMIWATGTAFLFGLAAADLTARTGSLGPAIGLHVATNLSSLLILGIYGQMDGLAAWNLVLNPTAQAAVLGYAAVDAVGVLVAWLLARLVLRV
jgi:uncharacterized protein